MTITELDQIAARADAATEGPWTDKDPGKDANGWPKGMMICATAPGALNRVYSLGGGGAFPSNDRAFIAASRVDVPALVAFAREQLAEIDRLRARLRTIYDETEPYADGSETAPIHDKLCARIAHLAKP